MLSKAAAFAVALSQTLPAVAAVHEKLTALPQGWTAISPADERSLITFTVALTQQNIDQLDSKLLAVSTPGSQSYGQYLSDDELNTIFAPTVGASSAVESWLKSAGVTKVETQGAFVTFSTTVGTANSLLNTTFSNFESNGVSKIRTSEYSIPQNLTDYIDLIDPTIFMGKTTAAKLMSLQKTEVNAPTKAAVVAACSISITPRCLQELYNTVGYTPDPESGSRIGFGTFLNGSAIYSDLEKFEEHFGIPQQNFSTVIINNAPNDQDVTTADFGEANLDVQNIVGISHPLEVTEFMTGGLAPLIPNLDEPTVASDQNEPYLSYYQYLLSQPVSSLPQVISNSYGDDEQTVPKKYAVKVCNLIGLMGLRGISVLESSGDNGVGAPCQSNDGKKTPQFTPQFPGTCPYVTAVGGTVSISPEAAWVGSAGGFSNYFSCPTYQEAAIENYLHYQISSDVKEYYEPFTNFKGRGFPDISAHSVSPAYSVMYAGKLSGSGGTSAAAPVVAGIIGLLNDARLRAGKSALGFLNPFLYQIGFSALNDITLGQSTGCNGLSKQSGESIPGASIIPWATWNATAGWDPATGLGTPDFERLKDLVLKF